MKKKNVLNLIKYYAENNDNGFRSEAYEIAREFDKSGDFQLSEYIMALLSNANTFVPQVNENGSSFLRKMEYSNETLPLPKEIASDIIGIVNAVGHNAGVNKFLFQGSPGTGKTETVKQIARILERELYIVDFDSVIDSKLGQTAKNISQMFQEINSIIRPEKIIVLFDEIDAIALDRTNANDLREMGRATSAVLKGMDNFSEQVVLVATTNLYHAFDKALIRRFDYIVDFNRYEREDLIDVSVAILNSFLDKFNHSGRNMRLFKKIIDKMEVIPYPGELKNLIKTSIAFSNPKDEFDYLKRLYNQIIGEVPEDLKRLQEEGFTIREIEILSGISKSQVGREIKEKEYE